EVGDDTLDVTVADFLSDRHVAAFSERLRDRFHATLSIAVSCAQNYRQPNGSGTHVEIMLTGGGHALPMVRALHEKPSVDWRYTPPAPDLAERSEDIDFQSVRRQLAVAIGGAMRDLPTQTTPLDQTSPPLVPSRVSRSTETAR